MGGAYAEPGFLGYTRSGSLGWRRAFAWFCVPGLSGVALGARGGPRWPNRDPKRPAICTRSARDIHRSLVVGGRERGTLPPERGPISVMRRDPADSKADLRGGGE